MNKKLHERLRSYGIDVEGFKKCFCSKSKKTTKEKFSSKLGDLKLSEFLDVLKIK